MNWNPGLPDRATPFSWMDSASTTPVTEDEVDGFLGSAAEHELQGILGYEERPLVSADYTDDPGSAIVDALSTMVIDQTQVA